MQVASAKAGEQVHAPKGASGSTEPHLSGWRDAMDIVVKWRQLSEPNDQASVHIAICFAMLSCTRMIQCRLICASPQDSEAGVSMPAWPLSGCALLGPHVDSEPMKVLPSSWWGFSLMWFGVGCR